MAYDGWDCDGKHGTCMRQPAGAKEGHVAFGTWNATQPRLPGGLEGSGCVAFAVLPRATAGAPAPDERVRSPPVH